MESAVSSLFNTLGVIGMICILLAYFMQQHGWRHNEPKYLVTNIAGAVLLMISLLWHWNLASFLLECAWLLISGYGMLKWWRNRQGREAV